MTLITLRDPSFMGFLTSRAKIIHTTNNVNFKDFTTVFPRRTAPNPA